MIKVYFDFNNWGVGYYRGSNYHFICVLPTLVIRIPNKNERTFYPYNRLFNRRGRKSHEHNFREVKCTCVEANLQGLPYDIICPAHFPDNISCGNPECPVGGNCQGRCVKDF